MNEREAIAERVYALHLLVLSMNGATRLRGARSPTTWACPGVRSISALVWLHGAQRLAEHSTMPTNHLPPVA